MAGEQRWARSSGAARDVDPMDRFICPICLEVYLDPVRVTCGHTIVFCAGKVKVKAPGCGCGVCSCSPIFCSTCLQQCMKQKSPICAVCRSALSPSRKASDLERQMRDVLAACKGCHLQMALSNMRSHSATCSKYESYVMEGIKSVKKEQPPLVGSDVPNRFTFMCPYCRQQNLDQEGLVEHCNKCHFSDPTPVVCPICASMPWGDPGYRSANFMEHIQRRHRFSYDTFVDYSADEDAMMREAMVRSLTDN